MKIIKATSRLGKHYLWMYQYNRLGKSISEAYKKPSSAKVRAFKRCEALYKSEKGKGLQIIGASCYIFIAAWQVAEGLRVITPYKSLLIA